MGIGRRAFLKLFGASLASLTYVQTGCTDSWTPPRQFESMSESSNSVAVVVPATKTAKATVTVFRTQPVRQQLWRSELGNAVAPVQVFVSNDGQHVVTFNNWASVGYGDDVVALYHARGQLAKYSLEQFVPLPQPRTNRLRDMIERGMDLVMPSSPAKSTSIGGTGYG